MSEQLYCTLKGQLSGSHSFFGPHDLDPKFQGKTQEELADLGQYPYKTTVPEFDPLAEALSFGERFLDVDDFATDPVSVVALDAGQLANMLAVKKELAKIIVNLLMHARLVQGIQWKFNNADTFKADQS